MKIIWKLVGYGGEIRVNINRQSVMFPFSNEISLVQPTKDKFRSLEDFYGKKIN